MPVTIIAARYSWAVGDLGAKVNSIDANIHAFQSASDVCVKFRILGHGWPALEWTSLLAYP